MKRFMNNLKFTIIIPSYNQGQFIENSILSILNQTYKNYEIIVVDNKSTDNTPDILNKYSDSLFIVSEKDKGQTDAINKGLSLGTGDVYTYLNSDDLLEKDCLLNLNILFKKYEEIKCITGDCDIINKDGNRKNFHFVNIVKKILRNISLQYIVNLTNVIIQPSTFFKKDIIEKVGVFDTNLNYCMDYDYWLRILKYYRIYVTKKKLSLFRIHDNAKSSMKFVEMLKEEKLVAEKHIRNIVTLKMHNFFNYLTLKYYNITKSASFKYF